MGATTWNMRRTISAGTERMPFATDDAIRQLNFALAYRERRGR
jgi:hypothetical protein